MRYRPKCSLRLCHCGLVGPNSNQRCHHDAWKFLLLKVVSVHTTSTFGRWFLVFEFDDFVCSFFSSSVIACCASFSVFAFARSFCCRSQLICYSRIQHHCPSFASSFFRSSGSSEAKYSFVGASCRIGIVLARLGLCVGFRQLCSEQRRHFFY